MLFNPYCCQFFLHVEECVWAIEVCREFDLPVAAMITVGPLGDFHDVPPGECAVRMARAGADVVGTNCYFDPRNGDQSTPKSHLDAYLYFENYVKNGQNCKTKLLNKTKMNPAPTAQP